MDIAKKRINELPTLAEPADEDLVPMFDVSEGKTVASPKSGFLADVWTVISSMGSSIATKFDKAGGSLTGRIDFPATSFSITNPPIRFTDQNVTNDESSKGNILEWGGMMMPGQVYDYGIATQAYKDNPSATFTVPGTPGTRVYKKWAWLLAHYNSPASTGELIHQHLNLETVKADWQTVITRFQISFGEDVALVSFPNANVKVYNDKYFLIGTDAGGAYIKHDTALGRIVVDGNTPWTFTGTGGVRIGSAGNPAGRLHVERSDDANVLVLRNTMATANGSAILLIENTTAGATAIQSGLTGEGTKRFSVNTSGKTEWGSGSASRDTNLYRNAADQLKTDDKFIAALGVNMGNGVGVPATSSSAGTAGDVAYDANYVYICVATNTWKRASLASW